MKIQIKTIVRLIVLVIALVNIVLGALGVTPLSIDENALYTVISTVAIIVVPAWTTWKNNSFTKCALIADEYLKELRKLDKELTEGEGNDTSEL